MLRNILVAVLVGIATWIVVAIVGAVVSAVGLNNIGGFITGLAPLVGLLAGIWHFLTGNTIIR